MTSDTVDLERPRLSHRVRGEARRLNIGASVLDVVLSPLWLLGWVVFWVLLGLSEAGRLGVAAVRVGWMDARERARARQIATDRWPVRPKPAKAAVGGPR